LLNKIPWGDPLGVSSFPACPRRLTPDRLTKKDTGTPWGPVYGELLTFDDPEIHLPAIDRLEGFHPLSACTAQAGGGSCLYRRVLVPVRVNGGVLHAWLYVVDVTSNRGLTPLPSGEWKS